MLLKDKLIIVTGASEGLGRAITESLVDKGAKVAAIARDKNKLDELCKKVGNSVIAYSCDITDTVALKNTIAQILKEHGEIDGMINNAGIWHTMGELGSIDPTVIDQVISLNLTALIHCTQLVLPYLKRRNEAVIVNISSKSGTRPQEGQTVYCASKFGVRGFTDTLKLELKGGPVKVLGFYPSGMATSFFEKSGEAFSEEKFMNVDELADIVTYAIERPGNISIEEIQVEKY
jgi:NADP-dependent 3-hydroxy acid dehydrogenase YdfG